MPQFHNPKFLLDENVSHNLKKLLTLKGYNVLTVQELNKRGTKNSELISLNLFNNLIFNILIFSLFLYIFIFLQLNFCR